MSKKTTTTGSNNTSFQFAPGSVDLWTKNVQQWLPFAQGLYKNPFGNQMFQQENAIGQDQAAQIGQRNKSNILANANALGYSTSGGLFNSMLQRAGRDTGMMQGQAFRGAISNANQRAMTGLGLSSSFQPLLTGSNSNFTQTQQTSGLGTWLPQVVGAGVGLASSFFGGKAAGGSAAVGSGGGDFLSNMFGNGTPSTSLPTFMNGWTPSGYGYGSGTQPSGAFLNPYLFSGGK